MFQDYFCHFVVYVTQILSGTGIIYVHTSVGGLFFIKDEKLNEINPDLF